MKEENLKNKFVNATKWSTVTEIAAKLVSPVTNMILVRIISPEAFGVVATVTMIMSFADMFTDAGFQKYLVQHEFEDENEKYKNANVAFWTNFGISIFLWLISIVFREQIAVSVGNPGLGNVIAIACVQLLLTSFSSIQMALYRRDFDFKTLFLVRMVAVCIPFAVTIPLALLGLSYWSLIIGTIVMQFSNAIILTIKSKWKPHLFYKIEILKEMLSFSIWSLVEAISIWFTAWADVFIMGTALSQYYLGIYKTSTTMVNALMSLITASIVPVLFSALSRLQDDDEKFKNMYLNTQRLVSVFVFPLGIGIYLYSDLATRIMLGSKWSEASGVIGVWALTSAITIVLSHFNSEVYRAKGKPKLSFLSQVLHLVVLVPVCIVSSKYGFWPLVYSRAWIRMEGILVGLIIMKVGIGFPVREIFKNVMPTAISAIAMGGLGYLLQQISKGILWSFVSIIICSLFYFGVLYLFPSMRRKMNGIVKKIDKRLFKGKYISE
ncbi:polysaccharide biosynthesis protein [Fervidicella metallireducens AeB]|uniref:Polysaccharide biosynthesis protein n=1 Tax=Fervidicella metallireducens AeB TaxID=1403537 RepID=A0A017RUV9_9CLOT|nr:lipopolysaccharide biosynthesis protein [Fervidicella metallireducens]EYE87685.1 polysaccharide biosynthesis protein [Fervidicella metallireducens AeB]